VAYRHLILRIGHSLLRNLLQLGNRGRARCAWTTRDLRKQEAFNVQEQKAAAGGVHELK
jgi:hypothetical protein